MKILNKASVLAATLSLLFSFTLPTTVFAAPAGNLDQCANGPASSPEQCTGNAWQNGNLNQNQAHYAEANSVPFRIVLTDMPTSGVHTLVIEYDIKHGGGHAYDYLTSYNRTETTANPCSDVTPCAPSGTSPIPAPSSAGSPVAGMPTASFNALPASERVISIYNGSFAGTGITYVSQGDLNAAQSPTRVQIQFTASNPTVVFAWGGHIASSLDWGSGNSASQISGSPYHMRFIELNGSGGNQDRSLTASTVPPADPADGTLNVVTNVVNDDGGNAAASDFIVHVDLSGTDVDGSPAPGASAPGTSYELAPATYTVSVDTITNYTSIISGDCSISGTVTLAAGDDLTCIITVNDEAASTPSGSGSGSAGGTSTSGTSSSPSSTTVSSTTTSVVFPSGSSTVTPSGFPAAGFPPEEKSSIWTLAFTAGLIALVSASFVLALKKVKI